MAKEYTIFVYYGSHQTIPLLGILNNLINRGVPLNSSIELSQQIRVTNSVSLVVALIFMFCRLYGFWIEGTRTTWFAFFFMSLSISTWLLNINRYHKAAKVFLFAFTSFSVLFTYHVYTIGVSVLTSFFPILLAFAFFFDLPSERNVFVIALTITVVNISASLLLPRHLFYKVVVTTELVELSDLVHVIVSVLLSLVLLILVIRNKNITQKQLINEKKLAEETLKKYKNAQNQLINSEMMASLGLLSAGINHEIKNPLNFVIGSVENLERSLNEGSLSNSSDYIRLVKDGLKRINNIVNSLNHLSHQSHTESCPCDINNILDNCLIILQHTVNHNVIIKKNYDRLLPVIGNSGKLHQVFLNLLTNAFQAIADKGEVSVKTSQNNDQVMIKIKDDGVGIKAEDKQKIFEPFFTTKAAGVGTGLGLPLSLNIIKEHNGTINVTSNDSGTEFEVVLPNEPNA